MDDKDFIQNFAAQFEDIDITEFTLKTRFRDLEGWSSLTALSIMAMIDEEYEVKVKGDDIRKSETIEDLINIVRLRF